MRSPSPYAWISQYYLGFFFAYGVYLPFWALWFEEQGIAPSDIGLLIGLGLGARCISNLLLTPRLHRVESLIPALRWLSLASTIFIGSFLFTGSQFWMMATVTILFNLSCGPITPLSDAVTNHYAKLKILDYGRARLWGSIAFILGSTAVGYLVANFGSDMIVYTGLAGMAVSYLFVMRNPAVMPKSTTTISIARPKLMSMLKDSSVLRFLILVSLIQGSHAAYYSFSTIYWKSSGHAESTIGYLWSLGVVAEVFVFMFSKRMFSGFKIQTLFTIAAIGVAVRWGLTASTTNLLALIIIQALHGVTFALAHIATIQYIQKAEENRMVALQALYNAIPLGAFIALMTALSGWGYELLGKDIFWVMAFMGLIALFIRVDSKKSQPTPQIET